MKKPFKILAIVAGAMLSQGWSATQGFISDTLADYIGTARTPTAKFASYTHASFTGAAATALGVATSSLTMLPDQDVFQISTSGGAAGLTTVDITYTAVNSTLRKESRLSFMGPSQHIYATTSALVGPTNAGEYGRVRLMGPGAVILPNTPTGNITIESLIDTAKLGCVTAAGTFTGNLILTRNLATLLITTLDLL